MNIGFAAWGFRETPLEEQFKFCSKHNVYLEIGIANAPMDIPLNANKNDLDNIINLSKKYNVKIMAGATGNDFSISDKKECYDNVEKIKKVIDICNYLSVSYLRIFAGFSPIQEIDEDRFNTLIDCLNIVNEYAIRKNVMLCLETHGGVIDYNDGVLHQHSVSTNTNYLLKIESSLTHPIGINLDTANLSAVGIEDIPNFIQKIKKYITYIHLKDFKKTKQNALLPCACGNGMTNLKEILPFLPADKPTFIEYEIPFDIYDGLEKSLYYFKKIKGEVYEK